MNKIKVIGQKFESKRKGPVYSNVTVEVEGCSYFGGTEYGAGNFEDRALDLLVRKGVVGDLRAREGLSGYCHRHGVELEVEISGREY